MLIKRPVQAKGPAKHEVFAEFSSAQMSADVALKTQQFEQTQDGEAALAKEEMAKAKWRVSATSFGSKKMSSVSTSSPVSEKSIRLGGDGASADAELTALLVRVVIP